MERQMRMRRSSLIPIAALMLQGLAVLLAVGGASSSPQGQGDGDGAVAVARVIYIVDGDTFYVSYLQGEGLPISIRPYLIDTPEVNRRPPECYGPEAEEYAWDLLFGKTVWLVHYGRVADTRLLAFVYLDPERLALFQAIMVAQGFAEVDIRHPEEMRFKSQLERIQAEAQAAGRGLWGACH